MKANSTLNNMAHEVISLELEYSRVKKAKEEADLIFKVDFRYESRYLNKDSKRYIPESEPGESQGSIRENLGSSFKKLRNELAKAVHPDKHGGNPEMQEEFKQIQEAFEEGNITKLIETASRYEIDINLDDTDLERVSRVMRTQRKYIKSAKASISWAWMQCGRLNSDRVEAWKALRIDKLEFKEWFYSQGGDLNDLERECILRKSSEDGGANKDDKPRSRPARRPISGFLTSN